MTKIFDPEITEGEWKVLETSIGGITCSCWDGNLMIEGKKDGDEQAVCAIPEMLAVIRTVRSIKSLDDQYKKKGGRLEFIQVIDQLFDTLKILDEKHGSEK